MKADPIFLKKWIRFKGKYFNILLTAGNLIRILQSATGGSHPLSDYSNDE